MLRSIVDLYASLILAPAVLLALGGSWTHYQSFELSDARLATPSSGAGEAFRYEDVQLLPVAEGSPVDAGVALERGQMLELTLPGPQRSLAIGVQASVGRSLQISVSGDGEIYRDFWVVPGLQDVGPIERRDSGLVTRTSPLLTESDPVHFVRIVPGAGRGPPVVAGVRLHARPLQLSHQLVAAALWAGWLVLLALKRVSAARSAGEALERLWRRVDVWIGGAVIALALFDFSARPAAAAAWSGAVVAVLWVIRVGARRLSPEAALAATLSIGVALVLAPRLWAHTALAEVAAIHDLSVDHRSTPDGDEINTDGARFRGEAADLADGDFVVLFLGDSFTYGYRLDYDDTYPAATERALRSGGCADEVRIVNFGWLSSSPLLGFRLLREVAARYRPDLIVYNLDMTDFHDDLRYEEELRAQGEHIFSVGDVLWASLVARAPVLVGRALWLAEQAPLRAPDAFYGPDAGPAATIPRDRFFATSRPLDHSRQLIQRGVMRNLSRIHRYARDVLDVPMAVFLLPRAYQHSWDESPRNWERSRYEVRGPYVLEPFRYFEEVRSTLDYPVFDLLPAFQRAREFPLYLEDDPHWNPDGASVAGRAAAGSLREAGLVPCPQAAGQE